MNDERGLVTADAFEQNIRRIVQRLLDDFDGSPGRILLAKPCYDYWPGAEEILAGYCERIDAIVRDLGLAPGPDFHAAYATDQARWYGEDPVHPNVAGVKRMAELWHDAIAAALAEIGVW